MKSIVILDRFSIPSDYNFHVAFRLTVPTGKQPFFADDSKTSAYASAEQPTIDAIKAGQVVEVVKSMRWTKDDEGNLPPLSTVTADLEAKLADLQAVMDTRNPWVKYGTSYDGNAWTQAGVTL